MSCLMKFKWVKLPRNSTPQKHEIPQRWVQLASRAAFRKGTATYCGHVNEVSSEEWVGGVTGIKSILGVKSKNKAFEIMNHMALLGYIEYSMVSKLIAKSVRQILKKDFVYNAKMDDADYRTASFKGNRLLTKEIEFLLNYFGVTGNDFEDCMPEKGREDVPDFDMLLAERLLGKQLGCIWERSLPYADKLVLLNVKKSV